MTIDLTVLMSVFNGAEHVRESIESILSQTYSRFEFLIIDDASTDSTAEILMECVARDSRIRVVRNMENLGLGAALHHGVLQAKGTWIARMDADDIAFPDRLEQQMRYLDQHPEVDVLGTWAYDIDGDGEVTGLRTVPVDPVRIVRLVWANPFVHSTVVFKRDSVLSVGSYDPKLAKRQDYDLWFRCVEGGLNLANLPMPLLHYRLSEAHYRRNRWAVAKCHVQVGWAGCRRVGAPVVAYIGVLAPLLKSVAPPAVGPFIHKLLKRVDPRSVTVTKG